MKTTVIFVATMLLILALLFIVAMTKRILNSIEKKRYEKAYLFGMNSLAGERVLSPKKDASVPFIRKGLWEGMKELS